MFLPQQNKIIFYEMWKWYQIKVSVSVNKVWLGPSHIHELPMAAERELQKRLHSMFSVVSWLTKSKILTIWPFQKRFTNHDARLWILLPCFLCSFPLFALCLIYICWNHLFCWLLFFVIVSSSHFYFFANTLPSWKITM